jgi:PAS domain S-box-containing protein
MPSSGSSPDALTTVFTPLGALLAMAAVLSLLAWLYEPLRRYLLIVAIVSGIVAGALSLFYLFRETRGWAGAARELHQSQDRFANVVVSAMDPIITVDETQRIVVFNPAAERAFGYARADVIGKPLELLIPERFRAAHHDHVVRFGTTGITSRRMGAQAVLVALRNGGSEFPIEASISQHVDGDRTFYTVILRDVSERLRSAALLEGSEAQLRGILESAMDGIITVDEAQRVVFYNDAAEAMFGWSREEAIGAPLAVFIPERFRTAHADHVRVFRDTGTTSRRMAGALRVVTGVRRNREEFPIDASISQIQTAEGRFYTVILRDVTARFEAVEALRRSKQELQELAAAAHLTREQEKSRIARELHDELGQMLTMLQMDVAWCKDKAPADDAAFTAKLERMYTLLKSTIAATRRIASDLRPLMLDDLGLIPSIEWLVENFAQRTGIACGLAIGDASFPLSQAQASAVFRIVQESLTNIAKHAQASHADIAIEIENGRLVVRVEDDGVGFLTSGPRKPNSLGLLGLRERAQLLGGEATIVSTPGQGTMVEARFPLDDAAIAR